MDKKMREKRKERRRSKEKAPWPKSAIELYRPSVRRLSAKLVPTLADKGCHMVSVTDPYDRFLRFLDRKEQRETEK
jgi:hypothetical protein